MLAINNQLDQLYIKSVYSPQLPLFDKIELTLSYLKHLNNQLIDKRSQLQRYQTIYKNDAKTRTKLMKSLEQSQDKFKAKAIIKNQLDQILNSQIQENDVTPLYRETKKIKQMILDKVFQTRVQLQPNIAEISGNEILVQ
ncbi:Hypothetical_protein [Hexamita inflata]|uniref:Hypothetical_protein n=1 Tax=Hexamita inflata TaxID=28002 RepID=A0AA86U443_9EUKA|nr:Hypothetical protein HINF_LOCUS29310 [Hexamita inflata]